MVMVVLTVMLSTSILGSLESMLPLLLLVAIATLLFRPILVRIYSRAEIALHETLLELPQMRTQPKVMPELLHEAELETMEIPPGSAMIGRKLREIPLRQQTGASIVAIERAKPSNSPARVICWRQGRGSAAHASVASGLVKGDE
jgi:hypothetical protein